MRHWSQFSSGMSRYGVRIGEEVSTWSTIDPSLYRPTPDKPFQGIFVGDYAGHGCEFLLVMHTDQAPPQPPPPVRSPFTDAQREFIDLDLEGFSDGDDNDGLLEPSEPEPPSRTRQQFPADAATHYDDRVFSGALEAVKLTGD